jgi:hypothetical protein
LTTTALTGPILSFGQNASSDYNPDIGPSLFWGGSGILDPRTAFTYSPGNRQGLPVFGWLGYDLVTALSAVPYTAAAGAIVASANATSATLALVSANSATTGVYITQTFVRSDTGVVDNNSGAGLVALDAYASCTATFSNGVMTVTANSSMPISPGMVILTTGGTISQGAVGGIVQSQLTTTGTATTVGQGYTGTYRCTGNLTATSGTVTLAFPNVQACAVPTNQQSPTVYLWNAQAMVGRAVAITAAASATATSATVSGYDVYGYPLVETISITANSQVAGKKAFKYIKSVVLNASDSTHAYSVDTTDVIGLPLRSDTLGDILINSAASSLVATTPVTSATGYVPADRTTATATTGDVRGTYGNFTSATGANKLIVRQSPQAYMLPYPVTASLFGNTQYSNF